jgi:hypothetical protein
MKNCPSCGVEPQVYKIPNGIGYHHKERGITRKIQYVSVVQWIERKFPKFDVGSSILPGDAKGYISLYEE